jgi:hypothetical protein
MVKLFVFDGDEIPPAEYKDNKYLRCSDEITEYREDRVREVLNGINVPNHFLIRRRVDDRKDNFIVGIEKFLETCLINGHDMTEYASGDTDTRFKGHKQDKIWATDYNLEEIKKIWSEKDPIDKVWIWWPDGELPHGTVNECYLVLNGDSYTPENYGDCIDKRIHYQPDIEKRKKGLLSLILFDIRWKPYSYETSIPPKKPLRFELTLNNLPEVVEKMKQKRYFV